MALGGKSKKSKVLLATGGAGGSARTVADILAENARLAAATATVVPFAMKPSTPAGRASAEVRMAEARARFTALKGVMGGAPTKEGAAVLKRVVQGAYEFGTHEALVTSMQESARPYGKITCTPCSGLGIMKNTDFRTTCDRHKYYICREHDASLTCPGCKK